MPIQVIGGTSGIVQEVDPVSKAARVSLYNTAGNPMGDESSLNNVLNALNAQVLVTIAGQDTLTFDVESLSGIITVAFEFTINNSQWYPLFMAPLAGGPLVSQTSVNGQYTAGASGFYAVRARVSSITGGASATVSTNVSPGTSKIITQGPSGSLTDAWFTSLTDGVNGPAELEAFGSLISAQRSSQILLDFSLPISSLPLGTATSGGGSNSQSNGLGQFSTGAAATASSSAQSYGKLRYQPGREVYSQFTAAFTTPSNINSNQRAGVYDSNNGFWVGYEGTSFGISKRNLGTTTSVAQAAFNLDTLTGQSGSDFTSNGLPVALDPTKFNVYRIRFGWLGGATISFQIMAPDGNWVSFHRIQYPNTGTMPSVATPNLPITMEVNKTGADATVLTLSTSSWDVGNISSNSIANGGNVNSASNGAAAVSGPLIMGLDGGVIGRAARIGEFGTLRSTSEILLWHDSVEGATVNSFWTQSNTTMTIAQTAGVLTLNNSNITTLNTNSIITSQRQFQKYPRCPLYCRFRANITANVAANHTLVELGLGAPSGVTATINNGAFFRWTAAGTLVAVVSFNGTEFLSPVLLAQGANGFNTANYYYYDVIVDDDYARFLVSDANGVPLVDTQVAIPLTVAYIWSVSHSPSFARVYVDATGGGTAIKLNISAHSVQMLDNVFHMSYEEQSALMMRSAAINPTSYAQTASALSALPSTLTPANATTGFAGLGGEYAFATPAAAIEAAAAIFSFQIPSPYSLVLEGLTIGPPIVSTTIAVTGIPFLEWIIVFNATTNILSTGGGIRVPTGIQHSATAINAPAGTMWNGAHGVWQPKTPIVCLPGTWLHIAGIFLGTTAAGTPGVHRGAVFVDGHFV